MINPQTSYRASSSLLLLIRLYQHFSFSRDLKCTLMSLNSRFVDSKLLALSF